MNWSPARSLRAAALVAAAVLGHAALVGPAPASAVASEAEPVVAEVTEAGIGDWYRGGAQLVISPPEGTVAEYRLNGTAPVMYVGPVPLLSGTNVIVWRLVGDEAVVGSGTITAKVDPRLPAVTSNLTDRKLTLMATDAESGVDSIEYRLDGGEWVAHTSSSSAPVALDGDAHDVEFRAIDKAGNVSEVGSVQVPEAPHPVGTSLPTVTGATTYGGLLHADAGGWDLPVTARFQWLRDGVAIVGATASSYRLTVADVGHRVSVRVLATSEFDRVATATSAETATVQRATSRTSVTVSKQKPRRGQKQTVTITVGGAGVANGIRATGQVRILRPGAKPVVKTLRGGAATLTFTVRSKGRGKVAAQYLGSAALTPGATSTLTYRAR